MTFTNHWCPVAVVAAFTKVMVLCVFWQIYGQNVIYLSASSFRIWTNQCSSLTSLALLTSFGKETRWLFWEFFFLPVPKIQLTVNQIFSTPNNITKYDALLYDILYKTYNRSISIMPQCCIVFFLCRCWVKFCRSLETVIAPYHFNITKPRCCKSFLPHSQSNSTKFLFFARQNLFTAWKHHLDMANMTYRCQNHKLFFSSPSIH